uniref:KIB1-4 beta-propeller domain-containing protein n=1 Tax=Leersia perrieri TaxID=77586 RepID=A0A0D9VY58_9ORYZ
MEGPSRVPVSCLAVKHGADSDKPALFSISDGTAIHNNGGADIPGLTNDNAWVTPQGWILVRSESDAATFLQNPQDPDDKIHLPHLPHSLSSHCMCVISGKPRRGDCVVLLVEPDDDDDARFLWYCLLGGEDWARHEYDIGTQPDIRPGKEGLREKVPICNIAACRGKFYFNGTTETVGELEFTPTPMFSSIAIADPLPGGYGVLGVAKVFLVESDGELYMQWHGVEEIDGRAFLLASGFGASRPADSELRH